MRAASAAYSAQVVGTGILYWVKRSLRYISAMGPPSTGMAYTLSPSVAWVQAHCAYRFLSSLAPYLPMSASLPRISKVGISWNSTMATSGAPLPAWNAVFSLAYSVGPVPTLVQSTWTSACVALNASTTSLKSGYQAQTLMCTALGLTATLVTGAAEAADGAPPVGAADGRVAADEPAAGDDDGAEAEVPAADEPAALLVLEALVGLLEPLQAASVAAAVRAQSAAV